MGHDQNLPISPQITRFVKAAGTKIVILRTTQIPRSKNTDNRHFSVKQLFSGVKFISKNLNINWACLVGRLPNRTNFAKSRSDRKILFFFSESLIGHLVNI